MKGIPASRILSIDQRSPEWYQAKRGRVGASQMIHVMSKLKSGGEPAGRANLKSQLVAEILTDAIQEHYVSPSMLRGIEYEPLARAAYEEQTGNEVELIGCIQHPTIERACCSPDGFLDDDGLVEFKVPDTTTHLNYLLARVMPLEYVYQVQWQMACTGRKFCEFVSFDDRLPSYLQLFIIRVNRDEKLIHEMEQCVRGFLLEVDDIIARLPKPDPMGITDADIAHAVRR